MNRRDFLKTSAAIAATAIIPIDIMAEEPKNKFIEYAEQFKVYNPKRGLIPFAITKHQKELVDLYDTNSFVIAKKYRQGGFTTVSILWALYKCVHEDNQSFLIVSRSAMGNKQLLDQFFKQKDFSFTRNTQHFVGFENGSRIFFMAPTACRGIATNHIIFDEAAFTPSLEQHYKAMYPCVGTAGKLFMVSTPNGKKNYFHKLWESGDFYNYSPNCWEHPDYQNEDWVKGMRDRLGEKLFRSECLGEFI